MTLRIREDGQTPKILLEIENLDVSSRRAIRGAWFQVGRDWKAAANREILRRPKGGRTYFIRGPSGRRRRHVASAPGETHANRSGKLRKALSWKVRGAEQMDVGYGVGSSSSPRYAPFVEFGTSRMEARPSVENAIDEVDGTVETHFEDALRRELT